MVDVLLDFMLGPFRGIGEFYYEHQMIFNPIVILAAFGKMWVAKKNRQEVETS
ncbi:hypothetical protein [Halobacillus sp. K22]|uniref:hypothetical protein n=1 Tax=Halobacillus sp. K22 TaxID=3457431 RepID=UPI003FCC82FF